jgi:hypothetical protein
MGYYHCRSCRSWSGGPVNAFTLWKPHDVQIVRGKEHIGVYQKTPVSQRQFCVKCGGHLMAQRRALSKRGTTLENYKRRVSHLPQHLDRRR